MFRKNQPHNIQQTIGKILGKYHKSKGFYFGVLKNKWITIVGEEISKSSTPVNLFEKNLIIKTTPSGITTLNFQKDQIINNVNQYFGITFIENIKFIF